jgi:hypothetical protein
MTFEELLKACQTGTMPKVKVLYMLPYAQSDIGTVTTIKDNGKHKGIGVQFPGMKWETWFADSKDNYRRTKYMRDLILFEETNNNEQAN